jgi:thioredoxin:protein disulfide reductase
MGYERKGYACSVMFVILAAITICALLSQPLPGQPLPESVIDSSTGQSAAVADSPSVRLEEAFDRNWLFAFFGVFFLGLALNLTPCVYPMLAVTVSVFGSQTETNVFRVAGRAVVYVLGIATMYSVLGVMAALTGGLFGGILQSRAVLIGISILLFALALSMLGLFEFQVPRSLISKIDGNRSAGLAGNYISGLFVGIFAAPCIGPPIVALLALVGHRGDAVFGFFTFFVLSMGLGFPYLVLGMFSGLLKRLPRSGEWMIWVRKLMSMVLICVGLFYLSLAVNPALSFILIPLVLAAGGIYLGFFEKSSAASVRFSWFKRIFGVTLLALAVLLYHGGRVPSLGWEPYSQTHFTSRQVPGELSLLYFSADWCVPCLELDRRTFVDSDVIEKLNIFTRAKVDLTRFDSPESVELRERYSILGVPTIIFLDGEQEIYSERIVGYVSSQELLARIMRAQAAVTSGDSYDADASAGMTPDITDDEPLSTVRLVADVASIKPGMPFRIGVFFTMREEWHVYWKNRGDSGSPPEVEWNIPFDAGDIAWPAPQRFDDGLFATFGHEDELLLSRQVLPPDTLRAGEQVEFKIDASWLVCRDICIGQDGGAELILEVRDEEPAHSSDRDLFRRADALLPVNDASWRFAATLESRAIVLELEPPQGVHDSVIEGSEFFPSQQGILRSVRYPWTRQKGILNLFRERRPVYRMRMVRERLEPDDIFRGVLVLPEGSTPRVIKVSVPLDR